MSGLELLANSDPPEWVARGKLLGLFGAAAVYLGAIRLWYHKARTDALDGIQKEAPAPTVLDPKTGQHSANPAAPAYHPDSEPKVKHLGPRLISCVIWLRALAILDALVLVGAAVLFVSTFKPALPRALNAHGWPAHADPPVALVLAAWMLLLLFVVAHVRAGFRAFALPREYIPPNRRAEPVHHGDWLDAVAPLFVLLWLASIVFVMV